MTEPEPCADYVAIGNEAQCLVVHYSRRRCVLIEGHDGDHRYDPLCPDCARLTGFPGSWREHRLAKHGPSLVKNSQDGARVDQADHSDGPGSADE